MNSFFIILLLVIGTSSCQKTSSSLAAKKSLFGHSNSSSSVNIGYGRIVQDNPIILLGTEEVTAPSLDYSTLLALGQDLITFNSSLNEKCGSSGTLYGTTIENCYKTLKYNGATPLASDQGKWAFPPNSDDFWEVHTFGHMRKVLSFYHDLIYKSYLLANPLGPNQGGLYSTSISPLLYSHNGYWNGSTLTIYSHCNTNPKDGAYFSPYDNVICFPKSTEITNFSPIQDPPIIYHETGHYLMQVLTNLRNQVSGILQKAEIGLKDYDEGLALQEGISDFIAYGMTGRTHFGEWGLGKYYHASRPLSEDDDLHAPGISKSEDERLSYPKYIGYDPNDPAKDNLIKNKFEIIHYTGQIASHYLVSLVEDLKTNCGFNQEKSFATVFYILAETFAELGDLTSKQSDNQLVTPLQDRVNFSSLYDRNGRLQSLLWNQVVTPVNYRSFFQKLALKMMEIFNSATPTIACSGGYDQDKIEKLLDLYGLLLFKTYNDNRNGYNMSCSTVDETLCNYGHLGTLTTVNNSNRVRSKLISKQHLGLPQTNSAMIVDDHDSVLSKIISLRSTQIIGQISDQIPSDLKYNNGNGRFSPGEIVLLLLNLKNSSNYPMAGVQILGNDWDQGKLDNYDPLVIGSGKLKACNNFSDGFPTTTEGAASSATGSPVVGDCEKITRTNGINSNATNDIIAPVCWIQFQGENQTEWISQETFRQYVGIEKNLCLEGADYTENCFIRLIPGGESASFSVINGNSTWVDTFSHVDNDQKYSTHNFLIFEISPWIPPNTIVNCRLRARFTNCDECWHKTSKNNDDPLDYEYSGGDPYFKIINYKFNIID